IDWDWEMPVVTLAALVCGAALLLAAHGAESRPLARGARVAGLVLTALLGAVALLGFLGNRAAASSSDALDRASLHTAATPARFRSRVARLALRRLGRGGFRQLRRGAAGDRCQLLGGAHVVADAHVSVRPRARGAGRNRRGGVFVFQCEDRLLFRHLVAFVHE